MRRSFGWVLIVAAIAVVGAQGCGETAKDTRAADEAAIRQKSMDWSNAAQSHDADKAVSFYAPDAVVLSDQYPISLTPSAIRDGWQALLADKSTTLSWKTSAVGVAKSGDIAYEYGAYTLDTTGKDGEVSTRNGKYLLVWKKQADGTWKVAVDTDNADAPPPAPAPPTRPAHHAKAKKHHHRH